MRNRNEGREERVEGFARAVCYAQRRTATLEAFDGGAPGGSTGAQQENVRSAKIEAEGFLDGRGEAIAIGVEAVPAALGPALRIAGAHGPGGRIDLCDAVEGDDFMRDSEVDAAEFFLVQEIEGARQVVRVDFESEILPVAEVCVRAGQFGQCGVVHRRADRVFDRVAEDGE